MSERLLDTDRRGRRRPAMFSTMLAGLALAGATLASCGSTPHGHMTVPKPDRIRHLGPPLIPDQAALCLDGKEPMTITQVTPEPLAGHTLIQTSDIIIKDLSSCGGAPFPKVTTYKKLPALIPATDKRNNLEIFFNAEASRVGDSIGGFEITYYTTNSHDLSQEFVTASPPLEVVIPQGVQPLHKAPSN